MLYEAIESGKTAEGTVPTVWVIEFPGRCEIVKLVIAQYQGTPAQFTAELFNHNIVAEGTGVSASDSDTDTDVGESETGPYPEAIFKIGPTLTSDAAGVLEFFGDADNRYFAYTESKSEHEQQLGRDRRLYIRITPQGSGTKVYGLAIAAVLPSLQS